MNLKKIVTHKLFLLALVCAALVSYVLYVEIPSQVSEAKKDRVFKDFAADSLNEVDIKTKNESFTLLNTAPKKIKPKKTAQILLMIRQRMR